MISFFLIMMMNFQEIKWISKQQEETLSYVSNFIFNIYDLLNIT